MKKKVMLAAIAATMFAGSAFADIYSNDLNVDWDTSTTGEVATDTFNLGAIDSIDSISLDLSHTWASDFEIFLTAPDATVYTLMMDQGSLSDLGIAGTGFLDDVATYTFVESGGDNTWGEFPLNPAGTYDALIWGGGAHAAGEWFLSINDDAGGDGGAVGTFTVNYTVPAPGAFALLGLGGFAFIRRRR